MLATLLGGRFIRLDYTWSYRGAAQEGSLLIGYQSDHGKVTAHWIDSWHMSEGVMACEGAVEADGTIAVRGSYAAPPGPDWGWRIVLRPSNELGDCMHRHVQRNARRTGGACGRGDLCALGARQDDRPMSDMRGKTDVVA